MVIVFKERPVNVAAAFSSIKEHAFEHYRDATFSNSEFDLTLLDCWEALARGKAMGWFDKPTTPGVWGRIILEEYDHYEDPLNGDLHIVVPDRFVAFKGPKDLPGGREFRDARGTRDFSPGYYVDIFRELGVKAVVRLNEKLYDEQVFEESGIRFFDLEFDDCTSPPDHIVAAFFRAVDSVEGLVAVHCKAGLGRTGTLIALDLMRRFRFTAREAMGWLRVVRPGSVIGDQQAYLCDVEAAIAAAADPDAPHAGAGVVRRPPSGNSEALARQVAEGMDRRAAERIQGQR
jgi:cell division cycle 14